MAAQNHEGKIALITGANKGIGYELARQLGKEGVTVLIAARSAELGNAAAAKLKADGADAYFIELDVTKPETIAKVQAKVVDMPPKPDAPVGTPSSGGYGLGWGTVSLPFAPEPLVFHGGSNNKNLAYIVLQPKQELGVVTMTNISGPKANDALMAITELLYKRFGADQARATQKP